MTPELEVVASALHKNGKNPFVVAIVDDPAESDTKLVVLFEKPGFCAVFSLEGLTQDEDISGDWTGARYEERLRPLLFPTDSPS